MRRFCVADAVALAKTAMALDCGDRILSREELERATSVLSQIASAHDLDEVYRRIATLRGEPGVKAETLGAVAGLSIHAVRLAATSPSPKLRVVVSSGVHGNEPARFRKEWPLLHDAEKRAVSESASSPLPSRARPSPSRSSVARVEA